MLLLSAFESFARFSVNLVFISTSSYFPDGSFCILMVIGFLAKSFFYGIETLSNFCFTNLKSYVFFLLFAIIKLPSLLSVRFFICFYVNHPQTPIFRCFVQKLPSQNISENTNWQKTVKKNRSKIFFHKIRLLFFF